MNVAMSLEMRKTTKTNENALHLLRTACRCYFKNDIYLSGNLNIRVIVLYDL